MRCKTPLLLLILIASIASLFPKAYANPYTINNPTYFTSMPGAYIYFPSTVLPQTFSNWYYAGSSYYYRNYFNTTWWITTTVTITITKWFQDDWLEFTCAGAGIEWIHNGTKPHSVYINGNNASEYSGWTYGSGTITVTAASSSVSIYWGSGPPPPPPPPAQVTSICTLLIPENESICIANGDNTIIFTPSENTLCGLNFTLSFEAGGGIATFYNYYDVNFTLTGTFMNLIVKINSYSVPTPGGKVEAANADLLYIEWSWPLALTPFANDLMTFLGLGGLIGFFICPVYAAIQIKNKHYADLKWIFVIACLCFGLMIGWFIS